MPFYLEVLVLLFGLAVIIVLSIIITRRIAKQLSPQTGRYTYIVVALISLYYLVDAVVHAGNFLENIFFYFWLMTFGCELLLFLWGLRRSEN